MATKNPYYEAIKSNPDIFSGIGQASSLLQGDTNMYGQNRQLYQLGNIGSTGVGRGFSVAGDAGLASGNPYGMAGGLVAKHIGGLVDVGSYLFGKQKINIDQGPYKGDDFSYDLGQQAMDIKQIDPSKTGREAAGKTLLGGPVVSILSGIFAKKKAKKMKKEAQEKLKDAQGKFNEANIDRATRRSVRESFMPTTRPALFSSGYSDIFGQF